MSLNKDVDIKFNEHDVFLESPPSGTLNIEIMESQMILKFLEAIKPKGLNKIAKIS